MTAVAEILEVSEKETNAHPWTPLIREAREEKGLRSNREIADWVSATLDWFSLTEADRSALIVAIVKNNSSGKSSIGTRRQALSSGGSTESVMRLTAAGSIWDQTWARVGYKETRELTFEDVDTLELAYRLEAARNLIRSKWFAGLRDLMRTHKVKTAGGLEAKGVKLPPVELKVEDGE